MFRMSVMKMLALAALALTATLSLRSPALAQHDGEMPAGHGHAMAGMDELAPASCPGCGMEGGLCAHCQPVADGILRGMSVDMCPDCDDPEMLCERCSGAVAGALDMMKTMSVREMDGPEHEMVCLAGTIDGDFEALYGRLFELGEAQGLMQENMMTGSVLPDAAADITGSSEIYAAFNMPAGAEPQDPLFSFTVPAGEYMVFRHFGPDPGMTWMAAYTWLAIAGMDVVHAPAGEHHLGAPDENGNMTMDIYIPVVDDEMDEDEDEMGDMDDEDDGEGMEDDDDDM